MAAPTAVAGQLPSAELSASASRSITLAPSEADDASGVVAASGIDGGDCESGGADESVAKARGVDETSGVDEGDAESGGADESVNATGSIDESGVATSGIDV